MKTVMLASALILGLFGCFVAVSPTYPFPLPVPYHAFCRSLWLFATPCAEISTTIAQQIQAFSPEYMVTEHKFLILPKQMDASGLVFCDGLFCSSSWQRL
ncbi:hypothetical protein GOODEAATRI_022672 [Goodea atripinnis]|uniref:Lipoprotein n=1 Tax=Goodea atripinnis TaxID=208336 RepID=A0ABV0Q0L8_9TELE